MTEKHPTRNTKSLGPNFNKVLSLGTDSSYIINSKREHKHTTQHSETDIFLAKTLNKTPNNPVLSYKGNDYYPNSNKLKTTKAANVYSSISNYHQFAESEAERLARERQSPITTDEMAWYQLMEIEKNRNASKGANFGTLVLDDSRGYQKTLPNGGFKVTASKIDQRSPGYMTFQPKQKKKQIGPHKLPALDESRIAGSVPLKKRTESLIADVSPIPYENGRMEKNLSVKKLQQALLEGNHRAKSPKLLMTRKGPGKKDTEGFSVSHTKQYSVPFTEVYNEIAAKIFGQGVMKVNTIFGRNTGGESSEENRYKVYDKKVNEYFSPTKGKITSIKVTDEAFAEKSFDDLMSTGLKISRLKPTLGLTTSKTMTSEASPSPTRKYRKMGTYELANPESEESEDEFQRPVYKRTSIIKFNQEKPNLNNEETHIREETTGSSSQGTDSEMIKTEKRKVKANDEILHKSTLHAGGKNGENHKGETEKKSMGARSSKIVVETEEKNAIVNLRNTRKIVKTITSTPKNPDVAAEALYAKKLEVYKEFMAKMNLSYNLYVRLSPEKAFVPYKFSIGKGNNHMLLRSLMKNRWWWKETDSKNPKEINFLWTQWRNKKFFESLPTIKYSESPIEEKKEAENVEENKEEACVEVAQQEEKGEEWKQMEGDGMKRLFTKKEISMIEGNQEIFKGGVHGKEYEEICKKKAGLKYKEITEPQNFRICNHIEDNFHISNKKALWVNMKAYYTSIGQNVAKYLPLTFHVKNGFEDEEFQRFLECYKEREREIQEQETAEEKAKNNNKKARNLWIVKPGENTNKGKGISLMNDLEEIKEFISSGKANKESRTYLIQSYLDRPLLYNKRKFDIRCYMLISCINGVYKGYWYQEGYFRTSSKEFSVKNVANKQIHLTNDAIQKKYDEYGKWESGNKVSYAEFERYLEHTYGGNCDFYKKIYPQMKSLSTDTIKAVYRTMDPHNRENTFEVFGLDFMIDSSFNVWLIEVNTNPDITIPTPKLGILIPAMVENALRLTIDPLYPPPFEAVAKKQCNLAENIVENNKFELVFDELEEGEALRKTLKARQEALKVLSSDPHLDEEGSGDDE